MRIIKILELLGLTVIVLLLVLNDFHPSSSSDLSKPAIAKLKPQHGLVVAKR